MNIKFLKGLFQNYKAITSKDANTLYFITDTGALYLGDKLIGKDFTGDIDALETFIGALPAVPEGASYTTIIEYINWKAEEVLKAAQGGSNETAASVKLALDNYKAENDARVKAIEDDYLTSEDKAALQNEIDTDVKVVSDALATYKTSNDAEVAAVRVIAEAARTEEEVNGQIDAKITALNLGTTYEPIGAEARAKAYVDGKFTDANLDQYTTEDEVKALVDSVIAGAVEGDTLEGLVDLVEYINTHGGEATEMASSIEALEGKVETIEGKPAYGITDANIETWNGKTTMADVEAKGYAVAAELGALAAKNAIGASDITDGVIGKVKLDANVQASLDKADSALQAHQDISGKADKVSGAVANNFAGLDGNGNLIDSGKKAADFDAAGAAAGALVEAKGYVDGIVGVAASVEGGPSGLYATIQGATENTVKDCVDAINALNSSEFVQKGDIEAINTSLNDVVSQLTWGSF